MVAVPIAPVIISGPWDEGYALDRHTISSDFLGHDQFGNPMFDTKRTALGELVFRLKNRNDQSTIGAIADTLVKFIKDRKLKFDLILPVPPSRERPFQPTVEIARAVGAQLDIPKRAKYVRKVKKTPELKNVLDYSERVKLLKDAFEVDPRVKGQRVLLLDDLYRSGATIKAVARAVQSAEAKHLTALAVTKTRTRQ